jgi:hypothetical protein
VLHGPAGHGNLRQLRLSVEPDAALSSASDMRDHWLWRPEWTAERTCLYWYLTFPEHEVAAVLGDALRVAE